MKSALERAGFELVRAASAHETAPDLPPGDQEILARVAPFTMTSVPRRASLLTAIDHIVKHDIPGAIVEAGVWRGGSMMAAALALAARGVTDRDLWLYDTFEGMSEPTENDYDAAGVTAEQQLAESERTSSVWAFATLDDVRSNVGSTNYPGEHIHYVRGKVEDTIPSQIPGQIALLRLDTDWYESTKHELEHLYPRLQPGGVLIIDDYGHWQGARRAVDEYFADSGPEVYLHRVDYTARAMVKP